MSPEAPTSIPISDIPGAVEAGILWMHATGVHTKAEARRLAAVFVEDVKELRAMLLSTMPAFIADGI